MSSGVSESRVLTGDNPFGVDPDHYRHSAQPDYSDPLWSETHFWSAWNPDDGDLAVGPLSRSRRIRRRHVD